MITFVVLFGCSALAYLVLNFVKMHREQARAIESAHRVNDFFDQLRQMADEHAEESQHGCPSTHNGAQTILKHHE